MAELEEILEEVARGILGLPAQAAESISSLKKMLGVWPTQPEGIPAILVDPNGASASPPRESGAPTTASTEAGVALGFYEQGLAKKLRECERKFQRKADELQKLEIRLKKEQKARREAEAVGGRASQEAADWHRAFARSEAEKQRLHAELERVRDERARLEVDKKALEEQLKAHSERLEALEAQVQHLEGLAKKKEQLEAQLEKLRSFRDLLPEPFPPEALLRVLVLDYPSLGGKAEERVERLIEGYRAFLNGEDHPALRHSNRELLLGEAEGMVLVGLERLLLDLASLPLARWLRTHAFRLEAWLQDQQKLSSPRLMEE
jgi:hypothetical protein